MPKVSVIMPMYNSEKSVLFSIDAVWDRYFGAQACYIKMYFYDRLDKMEIIPDIAGALPTYEQCLTLLKKN